MTIGKFGFMAAAAAFLLTGFTAVAQSTEAAVADRPEVIKSDDRDGVLKADQLPDPTFFLPKPATPDNPAFCSDLYYYTEAKKLRGTPRGEQALRDAPGDVDSILATFSPAFGASLSSSETPEIYRLIQMVIRNGTKTVSAAKKVFNRTRPYAEFREPSMIPEDEAEQDSKNSYPSGHATKGWETALLLMEINPENQDTILSRGYQFGESRIIAGFHYKTDIDAGRLCASAVVARLHADKGFRRQMVRAKKEFAALQRSGDVKVVRR
jgi:acid phosphatase (class A)